MTTTKHRCPGHGCQAQIDDNQLCCRPHWFEIPKELRDRIWHTYKKRPFDSAAHRANVMEAIRFLQAEPTDAPEEEE